MSIASHKQQHRTCFMCSNIIAEIVDVIHRFAVDLLNDIADLQSGFSRRASLLDIRDDHAGHLGG